MKQVLKNLGLPVLVAVLASIGVATSSFAQTSSPRYSRSPIDSALAQGGGGSTITPDASTTSGSGSTITPSTSPKGSNLPSNYGVVRNVSGNTLEVRTLDGTSQTLTVPDSQAGPLSSLKRGDVVGYDLDKSGNITRLQPPEVENSYEGTISAIDEDQVTITTATGETKVATIQPATLTRLQAGVGKQVKITTYKGTWAQKVCCVQPPPPAPAPVPVEPPIQPPAGGAEQPIQAPVKGLW